MALIIATIPAISLYFVLNYSLADTLLLWVYTYAALCGAAMVGVGVSANNPIYDDTQSAAFRSNRIITLWIVAALNYGWFFFLEIRYRPWTYGLPVALLFTVAPLLLVGVLTVYVGARRFGQPIK
jgi:cobalamin synthase